MPHEVMQVSPLPPTMLKQMQEEDFVLHDHAHLLDPHALAKVRALVGLAGGSKVDAKLLKMLPQVQMLALIGQSLDGIELDALRARGIQITLTPTQSSDDEADWVMALMLALGRRVVQADRFVRNNDWVEEAFARTPRFSGKRLGLLGLGGLGQAVARRAEAFGMTVAYWDVRPQADMRHRFVPSPVALATDADYLVVALPARTLDAPVVTAEVLRALGPTGYFVNTRHASLVEESVLVAALQSKQIAGAALDVFWEAPRVPTALRAMPQVVLSPHTARATHEDLTEGVALAMQSLRAFFEGRPLPHLVSG